MQEFGHKSVLLDEVLDILDPKKGESLLDVTLGLGGHSEAILKVSHGSLVGIDADEENLKTAEERLSEIQGSKKYIHSNFLELPNLELQQFDMILADLGMSSRHIDDPTRGFTFHEDVPLDLRYDRSSGATAAECIEALSKKELADIFYQFGEIKQSRKLAAEAKKSLPKTTAQLRAIADDLFGYKANDLLPQIFQALRISVNHELYALRVLLDEGPRLLNDGGRMAIISFHSLEDRMVKQAFRDLCAPEIDDRTGQVSKESEWELLTKKPIKPSNEECDANPRARSAKMRAVQRKSVVH